MNVFEIELPRLIELRDQIDECKKAGDVEGKARVERKLHKLTRRGMLVPYWE